MQRDVAAGRPTELEALAGRTLSTARGADKGAVAVAARELMAAGPQAVVVTLGAGGLWAVTGEGSWQAVPPADVGGNPTGAGDAVAAGLAHGLVLGRPWGERLRHAGAVGEDGVAQPDERARVVEHQPGHPAESPERRVELGPCGAIDVSPSSTLTGE